MPESDLKNIKEIFLKAKKGDKEAFLEIYEVYFKPLYCYVYLKIGNKAESDDLVQDIFIKALDSNENSFLYDSDSSPAIRFYSVAKKSVSEWKRRRRRNITSHESLENYSGSAEGKTDENMKREEFDNLRKAMEELSDEEQDAVIFKFIGDLSNEDIGLLSGLSARSARRMEAQGLISIRDIFKKQYE